MSAHPQEQPADEAARQRSGDPNLERAEELVDRAGERLGQWLTRLGHETEKVLARAREEAEDIWAEAQHLRRNGSG